MKKIIKKNIYTVLLILIPITGWAQLDPDKMVNIRQFDGIDVADLLVDQRGILWANSLNQVRKYDGYNVTHFMVDNRDTGSLHSIVGINRLMQDSKENIWISGYGDINRYDYTNRTFSSYSVSAIRETSDTASVFYSPLSIAFYCMEEGDSGRVVFGFGPTFNSTSFNFDNLPENYTTLIYHDPEPDMMGRIENSSAHPFLGTYLMSEGLDNDIWLIDINGLFHLDKNLQLEWIPEIRKNTSRYINIAMKVDTEGNVWILSWPGELLVYNPVTKKVKSYALDNVVKEHPFKGLHYDMVFDKSGNLWIAWNKGILFFNGETEKSTYSDLLAGQLNPGLSVNCLCFDDFENLWIGTTIGLFKYFNRPSFNSWGYSKTDDRELINGWSSRIIEDHNGLIWISTTAEGYANNVMGITTYNPETGTFSSKSNNELIPGVIIDNMIGELLPGKILFNSNHGLYVYNSIQKKSTPVTVTGLPRDASITVLLNDKKTHTLLGTENGLYEIDSSLNVIHYFDLTRFGGSKTGLDISNSITGLVLEEKQGIWISTKDGLFFYTYNKQSIERQDLRTISSGKIYSQIINSIARTPDGTLWLGLWQGGLVHYNPAARSVETFSAADGMAGISVQGILYDEKQNQLWLSTFDGISVLNLNNKNFYNYYMEDGIRTLKYAEGAYLKTTSGLFIFGGLTGITYFDPAEFSAKALPPKVFISEFKVGDNIMQVDRFDSEGNQNNLFSLDYTQNNISIQYSGIQYDNPDKNRFSYRLLNFSDNWQEVKNVRSAYYYDLPPGTFTFQVKAANSNGLWSTPVSMSFEILPPWYRTWWAYAFYVLVIGLGIFTIDRTQRKRLVRKERERAENERKEKELEHAKAIEKAYTELKATQSQLIHSEKMASLGELTAGIAHEIKNPLNFVNNFSEVSRELLDEMKTELQNKNDKEVAGLIEDLKQNLDKINQHGKRADSIVKGMLLHSRGTSGEKSLTDINDLLDQYVNLTYHGMRAQDKEFNITIEKNYDESLEKINVVPQDISRVFLNIINNGCYAANEKKKLTGDNFQPTLKVSTKNLKDKVEIRIADNGNGIPKDILDKIFQPFFTTKPTGEGTGLGLSLSYDIVTKVHGGELEVETKEGEGTSFKILLPK